MENLRLNGTWGGLASVALGFLPDLASINTLTDLLLKFTSLVSVLLIIFLNIKKLRSNAPA